MIVEKIKSVLRPVKRVFDVKIDRFLSDVHGVVHVGANFGQERDLYHSHDLNVIWIEPIPSVFAGLEENIVGLSKQRAIQALVTDVANESYEFNVASNGGASSSIFEFKDHKDIWPDVSMSNTITITSQTLPSLYEDEAIDASLYDALVLDTQGSELLVLKGSESLLHNYSYIKTEISDFESYAGCCQLDEMNQFMVDHGFGEYMRKLVASRSNVGNYYEIVYKKIT